MSFVSFLFFSHLPPMRYTRTSPPLYAHPFNRCRHRAYFQLADIMTCKIFFQATLAPLVRIQENVPQFKLPPLEPGREYQLAVYAVNAKGRSENYIFDRVRIGSLLMPPYGMCMCKIIIII